MENEQVENGLTLRDLVLILFKNIIFIVLTTIITTVLAMIVAYNFITPKYSSTGSVVVIIKESGVVEDEKFDYTNTQKIIETIADLMTKNIVVDRVVSDINDPNITNRFIKDSLTIDRSTTNYMIDVRCTSSIKEYCNVIVDKIIEEVIYVSNTEEFALINNTIVKIENGSNPVYASPNKLLYTVLGFLLGLLASVAIAILKEFMSLKFRDSDEVEKVLDTDVIGKIYNFEKVSNKKHKKNRLEFAKISLEANESNYLKIAEAIDFSNVNGKLKFIQTTSGVSDEGKSTVLVNLAKTFVSIKKKVCIIDLDLKRSTINRFFDLPKNPGYTDYAVNQCTAESIINHVNDNLSVVCAGTTSPNSLVLIDSNKLQELFDYLKDKYDYILVDSPPVVAVTDALVVSKYTDGIIFVISKEDSKKKLSLEAVKEIRKRNIFIIGTVLTKISQSRTNKDYYYYYRYNSSYTSEK